MTVARTSARLAFVGAVLLAAVMAVGNLVAPSAARDFTTMNVDEIRLLQRRLADAACYKGPFDGKSNPALTTANKYCPDQSPVLRIETGMHVAQLWRVDVDTQCRVIVTGSEDKTVRLWSMPDGRLIRTERLPIGEGNDGKAYAVAISPDGRLVAAGGSDAHHAVDETNGAYIFDAASGSVLHRIGAFGDIINHLAFSPDGKMLAVALGGSQGIRVLDPVSGRELMADKDYDDASYGIAFGPDGALYATGQDGFVRRYGPDLERTAKVPAAAGKRLYGISVDSSGTKVAVGYDAALAVDILDATTLRRIAAADTQGVDSGSFSIVAWTKDGSRLIVGGQAEKQVDGVWHTFLRSYTPDGRKIGADLAVADNTISSLVPCGDKMAFAAHDPNFGLVNATGTAAVLQKGRTFDARDKTGEDFTLSADAMRVRFGLGRGGNVPVLFDIAAGKLTDAPTPVPGLRAANITGLDVKDWQHQYKPLLKGKPIELSSYETSRSLAIRDDRTGFALGAEWTLRGFSANGKEQWQTTSPGVTYGVNFARGGAVVTATFTDGTIRWYRWSDGKELLALFVDTASRRWVAWTPSGYYMASPGGEDLIGWHVNRGWDEPADFFPVSRFRERFRRPDVVRLVLDKLDEAAAVKEANLKAERPEETKPIENNLPPVIKILSPGPGATFSGTSVELDYTLRSPSGQRIDDVQILIDGSPTGTKLAGLEATAATVETRKSITVDVPSRDVDVGFVAKSGTLVSEVAHVKLAYRGTTQANDEVNASKPVLYALLVGVAAYQNENLRLDYSAKDAQDFATALKSQTGGLYRDVQVKVLTDKEATVDGVKAGLAWLQKQTTSRDLAAVFLAGHGMTDSKNHFWFLPYEGNPGQLATTALSSVDIMGVLRDLPGKKVLFLDACHAGAVLTASSRESAPVDVNAAVNDFATAESGLVVYGASTGRELSVESPEWHHGAFTKALIEAIAEGKADPEHKGRITTALLDSYLAERVKEMTHGEQHPVMGRPDAVPDFPLALVR